MSSRDRAADEHQLLSVSVPVGAARAAALWREPASYEPGRGKHHVVTHLYDWRHRPHLQATPPSALASPCARAARLPSNPFLALGSGLALHPARSSDAGVTLIRWVSICYGGEERREEEEEEFPLWVPKPSALHSGGAYRHTHRPQPGPGLKTCCRKSKEKVTPRVLPAVFPFCLVVYPELCLWNGWHFVRELPEVWEKVVIIVVR